MSKDNNVDLVKLLNTANDSKKVETTVDETTAKPGLLESLLNKVKQKEIPLVKNGGMLGIRG